MIRLRATHLIAATFLMLTWLTSAWAQESGFSWRIALSAPPQVRPLLEAHMEIYRYRGRPEVDMAMLQRLVGHAADDARKLLATDGYFSPQVKSQLTAENGVSVARIDVNPGQVAQVSTVNIDIRGALATNADGAERITRLKSHWRLPSDALFRQAAWDAAKDALLGELVLDGYPAAKLADSEALVDPKSGRVALKVEVDSGPLFRFGAIQIIGLERYPRALVENLSPLRPGEHYNHEALLRFQAALQASGYFSSASVAAGTDPAHAGADPVVVRVTEYPLQKIDLGVGYSTDTGPRTQAAYAHNNTFRPGWQGQSKLRLDAKQQSLGGELALLPEAGGWRNRLGAEAVRSDVAGLLSKRLGLTASRAWRTPEQEKDFALKFQNEEQQVSSEPVSNLHALTLNYSRTLRRVDDILRPRRGYMLNLQLGGAAEPLLSSRSFVRGYGRALYIVPLGRDDHLHLRGEFGAVLSASRDGIPSEFLFRTGGDQSIRGYAYQSLGVTEGAAIVGGRYLGVGTVEYQHDFSAQWGGALFIDGGNAVDTPSSFRPVYGYGVGVRWITPAGPINFDIARASETGKLRFHFTIGSRF